MAESIIDQELIPVRMINEFVYCPRLFWIEYVDREFVASHDTLDGQRVHKKVDQQSGKLPELTDLIERTEEGEARSITISSPELGIVGVIDFVEFSHGKVIPVDYKRGAIPDVAGNIYAPERIQIIIQAMLLRSEGYVCDEARVYFARSRRHVAIQIDEQAISDGYAAIQAAREQLKQNHIPPPLVNSPKCGRCSLASICLPDEVSALQAPAADLTIRRFLAPADDRDPLYVLTHGSSLTLSGETLVVKLENTIVQQMPLRAISHIVIIGNSQVSTQALRALLSENITIFYYSFGANLTGFATPSGSHSLDLKVSQFHLAADDPQLCLLFAKSFIAGKIKNQRTLIRRSLPEADDALKRLALLMKRVEMSINAEELLGLEGSAAAEYFSAFKRMLHDGERFDFHGRNRRPPKDPVNAVLSFAYAMLTKECVSGLIMAGFEPALGFMHTVRPGRPSLALDIMEEFRPLIADSIVLSLFNTGELTDNDFTKTGIGVSLSDRGRKTFLQAYERRLNSEIQHPLFGYRASYRRIIHLQARLLARAVQQDIPEYIPFTTR